MDAGREAQLLRPRRTIPHTYQALSSGRALRDKNRFRFLPARPADRFGGRRPRRRLMRWP
jgi:hypothetical protein